MSLSRMSIVSGLALRNSASPTPGTAEYGVALTFSGVMNVPIDVSSRAQ